MSTELELLWISPEGEVTFTTEHVYLKCEPALRGKPYGTLLRVTLSRPWSEPVWGEKIGPITRTYRTGHVPAHIKARCLLLGIQP